jgi:hypothetical protein
METPRGLWGASSMAVLLFTANQANVVVMRRTTSPCGSDVSRDRKNKRPWTRIDTEQADEENPCIRVHPRHPCLKPLISYRDLPVPAPLTQENPNSD